MNDEIKGFEATLQEAQNMVANYVLQLGLGDAIYQRSEPRLVSRAWTLLRVR